MATTMEAGLMAFLLADSSISNLIGTRFGPWNEQTAQLPAVTYELVGEDNDYTLQGCLDQPTAKYVLSCWASTQRDARALAKAVKNSRGGGSGSRLKELGANGQPANVGGVTVNASLIEDLSDAMATPNDAGSEMIPCQKLVLTISYQEQ